MYTYIYVYIYTDMFYTTQQSLTRERPVDGAERRVARDVGAPEGVVVGAPLVALGPVGLPEQRLRVCDVSDVTHVLGPCGGARLDVVDLDAGEGHLTLGLGVLRRGVPRVHFVSDVLDELAAGAAEIGHRGGPLASARVPQHAGGAVAHEVHHVLHWRADAAARPELAVRAHARSAALAAHTLLPRMLADGAANAVAAAAAVAVVLAYGADKTISLI